MAVSNRITWQNVAAPDFQTAGLLMGNASKLVGGAFDGFTSMMDAQTKQEAENLVKTQDYWTKMAEASIQQQGVDSAQNLASMPVLQALGLLGIPTSNQDVLNTPAISTLLHARVPKARTEATETLQYADSMAAAAEKPELARMTGVMINNPRNAVASVMRAMGPDGGSVAPLRDTTKADLLKQAYDLQRGAAQADLSRRQTEQAIATNAYSLKRLKQADKVGDADKRIKTGIDWVLGGLRSVAPTVDIDELGAIKPTQSTYQLLSAMKKADGENSNIDPSGLDALSLWSFDANDSAVKDAAGYLDSAFIVPVPQADGRLVNTKIYLPLAVKEAVLRKFTASGSEGELEDFTKDLSRATEIGMSNPGKDAAELWNAAGIPTEVQAYAAMALPAMDAIAKYPSLLSAVRTSVNSNTDLGALLGMSNESYARGRSNAPQVQQEGFESRATKNRTLVRSMSREQRMDIGNSERRVRDQR